MANAAWQLDSRQLRVPLSRGNRGTCLVLPFLNRQRSTVQATFVIFTNPINPINLINLILSTEKLKKLVALAALFWFEHYSSLVLSIQAQLLFIKFSLSSTMVFFTFLVTWRSTNLPFVKVILSLSGI